MKNDVNGFAEYRRLILRELERLNEAYDSLRETLEGVRRDELAGLREEFTNGLIKLRTEDIKDLQTEVASLKEKSTLKATLIAAIAGAVPAVVVLFYFLASR